MYKQLQTVSGAHLDIKKATGVLASRSHTMAEQVNDNSNFIQSALQQLTTVERHVEHTDGLLSALLKQAAITIAGIA